MASIFSRVSGGGDRGLALLLFSPLFSALALPLVLQFLVVAIWSIDVDEIENTQTNDSRGKGILKNP
jgi:hypothetical protein